MLASVKNPPKVKYTFQARVQWKTKTSDPVRPCAMTDPVNNVVLNGV